MDATVGGAGWSRRAAIAAGLAGVVPAASARAAPAGSGLVGALGEAIVALPEAGLSPEVGRRMVWTVLDNAAVIAHGARLEVSRTFARAMAAPGGGGSRARILGTGLSAPPARAAAANAYVIHADEIDDSDFRGQIRASCVIMGAALAMAETLDVSGARFLEAAALGYTIQGRLAAPVGPIQGRGWMAAGVWGPIGAAALCARLMGLDAAQTASAMALAGSSAGGLFQYFYDQTEEKRIIVARAARNGIESAQWAALGEHGSPRILEGQAGIYKTLLAPDAPIPTAETLAGGLERLEGPLHLIPKFYAASASIIPTLDGLAEDVPVTVGAGDIAEIIVRGPQDWARVLAPKLGAGYARPETAIGARINFGFVVALYLARRSALPADYAAEALTDPAIDALARRIRFEEVATTDQPLRLEVKLNSGAAIASYARDQAPLEPAAEAADRRIAKFEGLTAFLGGERQMRLRAHCEAVGEARSMRAWARGLERLIG